MLTRTTIALCLFSLLGPCLFGQGLDTSASKDDWEEINFEFNSSILSDGYPSLLRLADLLQKNPGYHVRLEGHADKVGGKKYNEKLALKRAETVKAFLVKYGAGSNQIETISFGKTKPEVSNGKREGRFINRRVVLRVTDAKGNVIAAGGIGEAIKSITAEQPQQMQCCSEILKRLDRLDDIVNMLKDLAGLKQEVAQLKKEQEDLRKQVGATPPPLEKKDVEQASRAAAAEAVNKAQNKHFALLGLNVGSDDAGHVTVNGRGRYFRPFHDSNMAFQAEAEYMYWHDRQEGQFDFGMVDRFLDNVQAGLFSSFKHVDIRGMQNGGTLGQAAFTLDYIFGLGRVGVFGTKGFMNEATINMQPVLQNVLYNETYLHTIDQVGASTTLGLFGPVYLEANLGYLKSRGFADRPGGTARLVFPITSKFAFTLEGGVNETLLSASNYGRVAAGFEVGNFLKPKEYKAADHAVPADIPRVRYEMLTRQVATGYLAPIADAGPDQIGVPAGTVTLNGTGSYSPESFPLTYHWDQIAGPSVSINGASTTTPSFSAAAGQSYSFRLTVMDSHNGKATSHTTVTTQAAAQISILSFTATPQTISQGQSSVLAWKVQGATTVSIGGIGAVDASVGTTTVAPTSTTTYTLTASNGSQSVTQTAVVTVQQPQVRIITFTAAPMTITAGQSANLVWATDNASSVTISTIGSVASNGNQSVSPAATTTYTLTATGVSGSTTTATVTVQVNQQQLPKIDRFSVGPAQISSGQHATLVWAVENATNVTISGVGGVSSVGTQDVSPAQTTTYTITASNNAGNVTSQATLTVTPPTNPVSISGCAATPSTINTGDIATLTFNALNASTVNVSGVGNVVLSGPVVLRPPATTTYVITATGGTGLQASCSVTVTVNTPSQPPPPNSGTAPVVVISPSLSGNVQEPFQVLDASASTSPIGATPLRYSWSASPAANIYVLDPLNIAAPRVRLLQPGTYSFTVTVTDSKGNSSTASTSLTFSPPVPPWHPLKTK